MSSAAPFPPEETIDVGELLARAKRGFIPTLGAAFLGLGLGVLLSLLWAYQQPAVTTLRATFSFPGFERGNYPDGTKFQPDDVRAPDVINVAIDRLGLQNTPALATTIRGAIVINGFVSPALVKERDRLRALGQVVPPLIPDEYEISIALPRDSQPSIRQRELLLTEITNAYREKFIRSYVELTDDIGNAVGALSKSDFSDYELILTKEAQTLISFLQQQALSAPRFRSPSNHRSFQDLVKEAELFAQINMTDVLSQIYMNGLSRDRNNTLLKMDYYLRVLEDKERQLTEEEEVVLNLLKQTQERGQNYVLAAKTQAPTTPQPLLDPTFIDTLLTNDAYNFLVRKALDAGLAVKRVRAEKAQLTERRQRMESFAKSAADDRAAVRTDLTASMEKLERDYRDLISRVRTCLADYSRQTYADAVRVSLQATTRSIYRGIIFDGLIGAVSCACLALGMSLIFPSATTKD